MEIILSIIAIVLSVIALRRATEARDLSRQAAEHARSVQPILAASPGITGAVAAAEAPTPPPEPEIPTETLWTQFVAWMKDEWLLKLGALIMLLGFGWLVTYAFMNDWIGEMGRIMLGLLFGALFLVFGWFRIQRSRVQGSIFLVLGSSVVLLTTFSARYAYDMFTPISALLLMFGSTIVVAMASYVFRIRSLANLSVILAGVVPLLTHGDPNEVGLWSYLLVVVLGAIWLVAKTGWRSVTGVALLVDTLYSLPFIFDQRGEDGLLFAYVFATVFFFATTIGMIRRVAGFVDRDDIVMISWNGLLLLSWIVAVAPNEWQSLILSFWAVVFLLASFLVFRATGRRAPFLSYAAVGVVMIGAATAVELEGATLAIVFALEAAVLSVAAYAVLRDIRIAECLSLLFVVPIVLSVDSLSAHAWSWRSWSTYGAEPTIFQKHSALLLLMTALLLSLAVYFYRIRRDQKELAGEMIIPIILGVTGSLYALRLIWLSAGVLFGEDQGAMTSLILYTLIGIPLYIHGVREAIRGLKIYGATLLAFVVGYLLLITVWDMQLTERIITFFLIGGLLMGTSFIRKHRVDRSV